VDDLYYLDEQLYRSLMQLKLHANQGGDVESLELFFEVSICDFWLRLRCTMWSR
jgi:hypothetical protein